MKRLLGALALCLATVLAACAAPPPDAAAPGAATAPPGTAAAAGATRALDQVTLMLDWVPNVNHSGLFVAREKGWFADEGLDVDIIQPGEVYAQQAVAGGAADFGVGFQEELTMARAEEVPVVSIAAIIQHNSSGFASRAGQGAASPADWEGLRYASFGTPFEAPTLRALMTCAGGDFAQLETIDTGATDPLALLAEERVDLAWIFYGTQGIAAEQQGTPLHVEMMDRHFDCVPDYYTPLLITSEQTIAEHPERVRAFLAAVSRGYDFAIRNPAEAAETLLAAAPETGPELLRAGQAWLSPRYQADAPRWGEQQRAVWEAYSRWMLEQKIIPAPIDVDAAFTNDFLPR